VANRAVQRAEQSLFTWAAKHPHAQSLPPHLQSALDLIRRHEEARTIELRRTFDPFELEQIREDLETQNAERAERRRAELQLADYIEEIHHATQWAPEPKSRKDKKTGEVKVSRPRTLLDIAESMRECRQTGTLGQRPDGGWVMAWDHKCGQVRLCPDESREETQRLTEWYLPALVKFAKADRWNRIFYLVPTTHNYRPGQLAEGKRELMERWKQLTDARRYCPIEYTWNEKKGAWRRKVAPRHQWPRLFNIRGSLVIQEDPLAASGDWNVHLNCFACVRGRFDWDLVRLAWGANIHIAQIKGEAAEVRGALLEAIKYAALIVPSKSADKAGAGETTAPAMVEWPHERWLEWWQAQLGFRRVRSYGELYGLHEKRWNAAGLRERAKWAELAEVPHTVCGSLWRDIPDGTQRDGLGREREDSAARRRDRLRKAMAHGERLDLGAVDWVGSISFDMASGYVVGLITGNNFSGGSPQRTPSSYADGPQRAPP